MLCNILLCLLQNTSWNPLDTGHKLNVHKTFRRRFVRRLNVLCAFSLHPVSRVGEWVTQNVCKYFTRKQFYLHYWKLEITLSLKDLCKISNYIWENVFKNEPSKICGRQLLKNLK